VFVFFGERTYGVVERCGQAYLGTRFAHLQFLPLLPRASFLFVEDAQGRVVEILPIALDARSVLAAYLRTWGIVFAGGAALAAFGGLLRNGGVMAHPVYTLLVVLAWMAFVALAFGVGTLTSDEQGQRAAYASVLGLPFDPARVPPSEARVAELEPRVVDAARSYAISGYRDAVSPESAWPELLSRADVTDVEAVKVALTLVRLRFGKASGAARSELERQHARLWERLSSIDRAAGGE
jgi:hypothetical protein